MTFWSVALLYLVLLIGRELPRLECHLFPCPEVRCHFKWKHLVVESPLDWEAGDPGSCARPLVPRPRESHGIFVCSFCSGKSALPTSVGGQVVKGVTGGKGFAKLSANCCQPLAMWCCDPSMGPMAGVIPVFLVNSGSFFLSWPILILVKISASSSCPGTWGLPSVCPATHSCDSHKPGFSTSR